MILRIIFLCIVFCSVHAENSVLVGIAGGSGSGKTTLANQLRQHFGQDSVLLSQDCYYKDLSHLSIKERNTANFDHPDSIDFELFKKHLLELKEGCTIVVPQYDFISSTRTDEVEILNPAKIILAEGILLFAIPEVRELFDLKIFIDADDDIRFMRRLERDLHERGGDFESIKKQYLATVKPMHNMYVDPTKAQADVVIWGNGENFDVATGLISGYLIK